jgi:Fe2+ or Zn2+ uptake regulation protein
VAEAHSNSIANALKKTVEEASFRVETAAVELEGLCSACEMDV